MKFVVYKTKKGYTWKALARNGKTVCLAGEPFARKENAVRAVFSLKKAFDKIVKLKIVKSNQP